MSDYHRAVIIAIPDTPLLRRVPPVYKDGTYEPVEGERINPFKASKLMERKPGCTQHDPLSSSGPEGCGSKTGKTAFLVYFGQQVVEELLDAQRPGCPPEYFNVPIPPDHEFSSEKNESGKSEMPFLRSRWSQNSGHSPGNPRQQVRFYKRLRSGICIKIVNTYFMLENLVLVISSSAE